MTVSRAFDLAQWVGAPVSVNDGVVVATLGPPFTSKFAPVLLEAPKDGAIYGRSNAAWVQVTSGGGGGGGAGGVADAPSDGTSYVRENGAWINVIDCGTF
jgi:hypothetical protein